MLKLKILGCNGLFPDFQNATSGYLVEGDNFNFLLDIGSGVFANLKKCMKPEDLDGIFISHLHHDHISDLGVFNYYIENLTLRGIINHKIDVYYKDLDVSSLKDGMKYLNFCHVSCDELEIKGVKIKFYSMKHPVPTSGITLSDGVHTVGYSGDTNVCDGFEQLLKDSDLAVCDAAFTEDAWSEAKPHCCVREVVSLAAKHNTMAILSHYLPQIDRTKMQKEAEAYGDKYAFAEMFKTYKL